MNYREKVRNSELYLGINALLTEQFPQLKVKLSNTLLQLCKLNHFEPVLEVICKLKYHPWSQATQWRIEVDFNEFQWSEKTEKPFVLGAYVMLEEVEKKRTLHFVYNVYNTFSPTAHSNAEKISEDLLTNRDFVQLKQHEIALFLETLNEELVRQVNQIDFKQLELLD